MPSPKKRTRPGKVKKAVAKKEVKKYKKFVRNLTEEEIKKLQEDNENLRCINLIGVIRTSSNKKKIDEAFFQIFESLRPQMQYIVNRFNIPGLNSDDIMQEALYALRYKAIKDYDQTRGSGTGPASFKLFALLCIRRHLTTERKSSLFNNRKKILNQSMSLDQEHRSNNEDLSLINIVPSKDDNILDSLQKNESYRNLMGALVSRLSRFEREVLVLYAQSYSYEEISDKINEKRVKIKIDVKGVDNALSRIKHKAKSVLVEIEGTSTEEDDIENIKPKTKRFYDNMEDEDFDMDFLS